MTREPEGVSRIAFVTNQYPHYRLKTFAILADRYEVDYCFHGQDDRRLKSGPCGLPDSSFHGEFFPGFELLKTRITPTLPVALWRRKYDLYISGISGRFALPVTFLVARLKRRPFVLWTGVWTRLQTRAHRLGFPLTRYLYRHADAIVVYGEHVKRYLIDEGTREERVFVAAHAVDNDLYSRVVQEDEKLALRCKLGVDPGQLVILYLGRFVESKGIPYLVEAFAVPRQQDSVLVLAGSGPEERRLKQLAEERGVIDRVRFAGYIPPEETIPYYAIATVLVLPSVSMPTGKEPWGLVVNEAFNQGVPVIATETVGAAAGGLVQDGVNGFVVPERDSAAIARALQRITEEPGLRERMSENARRVIAGWDNDRMVHGFQQAIEYASSDRSNGYRLLPRTRPGAKR